MEITNMQLKRALFLLLALLLCGAALSGFAESGDALPSAAFIDDPDAIEAAASSVVRLDAYDIYGDRIATGSGFAAFSPGILVTAAHVVTDAHALVATSDSGECFDVEKILHLDMERDLAICVFAAETNIVPLPCADVSPGRGEKAVAIGTQFGCVNLVTMGNVCGVWNSGSHEWLLFTAPVSAGNSGGPLFDRYGKVIGIVSGTYEYGQNLNLAIPIECAAQVVGEKLMKSLE